MEPIVIGFFGMSLILLAFFMNQIGKWKADFLVYDATNLTGAAFLITYSIMISSYPFLILNVVWGLVSLRDVFIDIKKEKAHLGHKKR